MRYESATFVGRGGIGEVYKAYDPALRRSVALKYLLHDDERLVERFLQEARLQARIDHESVCKVYEVGRHGGRPFIAMQYVDGHTLEDCAAVMSTDEKVRVVAQVAEAVHAAHEIGIIHRDLKPHNVMLEKVDGGWRPYVLDFGLAREHAAAGLTQTGLVLGTPGYISPEQARGDRELDRRTDVYALGCLLYKVLAGRPPFEGGELKAIVDAMQTDAAPLRRLDASLPADLETITARCLEKERERRYPTARELALDLGRYLAREPVAARAPTWAGRIRRRVRRNPRLAVASVIAATVVTAAAVVAFTSRRHARVQAAAAERFGQEAESVENILREAHLLPLHDTRPERRRVQERMGALETEMRRLGAMALGPGRHALGRGYLALGQYQDARRHLEEAWRGGYQAASVAYSLGRSLAELYRRRLEELAGIQSAPLREARRREIEASLRDPALRYLREGKPSPGEPQAYVEGLLALHGKRYDDALRQAAAAFAEAPWLYDAKVLEGDVHMAVALDAFERGAYDEALAGYEKAGVSFEAAALVARSDPTVYERDCYRLDLTVFVRRIRGQDTGQVIESGIRACGAALEADPEHARAAMRMCNLLWQRGDIERSRGEDPSATFERAIAMGEDAVRWEPDHARNWRSLGLALWRHADYEAEKGRQEAGPIYDRAVETLRECLRRAPDDARALVNLAMMLHARGRYDMLRYRDPRKALAEATSALERAAQTLPEDATSRSTRGIVWFTRGEYEHLHGEDPRPSFEHAIAAYDEALGVDPSDPRTHYNRSVAWVAIAADDVARGRDPSAPLDAAVAGAKRAALANPMLGGAEASLGDVQMHRARYAFKRGQDPRAHVREAVAAFRRSARLERGYAYMHLAIAQTQEIEAQYLLVHGQSPAGAVQVGLRALLEARKLDPAAGRLAEGRLRLVLAREQLVTSGSPERPFAMAATSLAAADAATPHSAEVLLALAELRRWKAEWAARRGSDPTASAEIRAGLAAADAGIAIKRDSAPLHAVRAALLERQSGLTADAGARAQTLTASQSDYAKALELDPLLEPPYRP